MVLDLQADKEADKCMDKPNCIYDTFIEEVTILYLTTGVFSISSIFFFIGGIWYARINNPLRTPEIIIDNITDSLILEQLTKSPSSSDKPELIINEKILSATEIGENNIERSTIVQNITYNIHDSVISSDFQNNNKSED